MAARIRMSLRFGSELNEHLVQDAAASRCDDFNIAGFKRLREWHKEGILTDLAKARAQASEICILPVEARETSRAPKHIQKVITKVLHDHYHTKDKMLEFFDVRLRHWFGESDISRAEKVWQNFQVGRKICVPHILTAYLKTVCNAWATTSRHGQAPIGCLFGCAEQKDSLSHYFCCPVALEALDTLFSGGPVYMAIGDLLGLNVQGERNILHCMVCTDCLHYAFNTISHAKKQVGFVDAVKHMRERLLSSLKNSRKLRELIGPLVVRPS